MAAEKQTVADGAVLECSFGTRGSNLRVPKFHGVVLQGHNEGFMPYSI